MSEEEEKLKLALMDEDELVEELTVEEIKKRRRKNEAFVIH